jgi:hypothetical protein
MGEVGVDPELVAQAATALEQLRDALAANVPTIVTGMSEYSSGVNTAILKQAQAQSVHDAADMRARARLAQLWEAQDVNVLANGMVDIPWATADVDTADAQAEAIALGQAESGDPKVSAATIKAIEADLKDHMGDAAWLQVFYNNAAPSVAALASTLRKDDVNPNDPNNKFTVLTKADQQTLATFAQGLATADKSGSLSPAAVQAIAHAPDLWSASMLVKFGPPGSSWATSEHSDPTLNPDGLSLLAVLTSSVYQGMQDGKVQIPLGGGYNRYGMQDQGQLQDTLADYDPLSVLMQADAQNKIAAQQVMGDTNKAYGNVGASLAKMLLWNNGDLPGMDARFVEGAPNDKGQAPGFFTSSPPGKGVTEDYSSIVLNFVSPSVDGAFLDAATSAPRGTSADAKYSAQAALNIIDNTPRAEGDDGVKLDPAIQQALTNTAQRYLLDLARSTSNPGSSAIVGAQDSGLPAWTIEVNGQGPDSSLSKFLEQITSNKSDLATLNAAAKVSFSNLYAQAQLNKLPPSLANSQPDDDMVKLLARITTAAYSNNIDVAADLDEQHEEYNKMLEFAEDTVKFVPGIGEAADEYMDPAKDALGLLGIPTEFSTDNAATAQQVAAQDFATGSTKLHISMVQGLINNGASDLLQSAQTANQGLPPNQQWLQNGQITLTAANRSEFESWYSTNEGKPYGIANKEGLYGAFWQVQGATSSQGAQGPW